jgi:hypothetical protein
MAKLSKDQSGFSATEAVLVLVIVVLVSLVGWLVYKSQHKSVAIIANPAAATSTQRTTPPKTTAKTPVPPADPTANWQVVTSGDKISTVKIPQSWVAISCNDVKSSNIYVSSSQKYAAVCGSGNLGEVTFDVYANDKTANTAPTKDQYTNDDNVAIESVIVNNVSGYRVTYTVSSRDTQAQQLVGTRNINYQLFLKGNSYIASYRQLPNAPEDAAVFNQIVQTWKF